MSKLYFVKISWVDPNQPLCRLHTNDIVELDLTDSVWNILKQCDMQVCGYNCRKNSDITIDFMMEIQK